jgi:hypothetical protein
VNALQSGEGYEFLAHVPELAHCSDSLNGHLSPLILLENDQMLGPAHALHDKIRKKGGGAYSHWGEWVHLSTSDNEAPGNRTYEYAVPTEFIRGSG